VTTPRQWWRRRRARPFDWAEHCPELLEPGGHVHLVSAFPRQDVVEVPSFGCDPSVWEFVAS
jgi:hypothetical protein